MRFVLLIGMVSRFADHAPLAEALNGSIILKEGDSQVQDVLHNEDPMRNITTNPRSAATLSFILALPLAILLLIAVFEIEPFNGFYETLFTEANGLRANALGLTVEGIAMLLLPVAFFVNLLPIVRNLRAGNSIMATPINLLLGIALLVFVSMFAGGIIADQYPCWSGVPNCD